MEKIINQPITLSGAVCDEPICGGVQGEHKATAICFIPDEELSQKINEYKAGGYTVTLKIDAFTAAGERVGSEEKSGEELFSPFSLTQRITASGLDCVVVARIIISREEARELCKAQLKLCFIPSPVALNSNTVKQTEAERLEKTAEALLSEFTSKAERVGEQIDKKASQVKASAETVARHLKQAQRIAESNENTLIDVEENTIFVFSGGDAEGVFNTDIEIDSELSEQSRNPVENGAVTRGINAVREALSGEIDTSNNELTEKIGEAEDRLSANLSAAKQELSAEINLVKDSLPQEFIVEQGTTDDGWRYRKWNSGLAECWARIEGIAEVKTMWPNQSSLYYGLIGGFSYPIPFLEKPTVSVDLDAQDSWCNKYASTNTETGNIYAVGPVSKSESYTLNIIAIGRWK